MLTKAILTGGVLSVLAGSIVYFGTEGADALEADASEAVRVEETELAGGSNVAVGDVSVGNVSAGDVASEKVEAKKAKAEKVMVAEVEAQDPPRETSKPKTKWLDQYLKKTKPEKTPEKTSDKMPEEENSEPEMSSATTFETESNAVEDAAPEEMPTKTSKHEDADGETKTRMHIKMRKDKDGARGEGKGTYIVSKGSRVETLDIEDLDIEALDIDGELDVEALIEELGLDSEKNVQIRVVKKMNGKPFRRGQRSNRGANIDYDMVLDEAKKLLVTDMRNQAFLEIVDHAIDQDDVMQAADIVDELSTPELRDTARARIGVGLAKRGDAEAAFTVLDELEIDELAAPIRLEIITALMATKQERKSFANQR